MAKAQEMTSPSTPTRLLSFLAQHGPASFYQVLLALDDVTVATVVKHTQRLIEKGKVMEVEEEGIIKLDVRQPTGCSCEHCVNARKQGSPSYE